MDQKTVKRFLKKVERYENPLSVVFGVVFIVIAGVLVLRFIDKNKGEAAIPTVSGENTAKTEKTYKVQVGDNLWKIAEKYYNDGFKWKEIAVANAINNPRIIEAGKEIAIPDLRQPDTPTSTTAPSVIETHTSFPSKPGYNDAQISSDLYTVVKGDNLWSICVRAYGDGYKWVEVAKMNNIKNPDVILPGMSLTLPR